MNWKQKMDRKPRSGLQACKHILYSPILNYNNMMHVIIHETHFIDSNNSANYRHFISWHAIAVDMNTSLFELDVLVYDAFV